MSTPSPGPHSIAALREAAAAAQNASDYLALEHTARQIVERCEASGDADGLAWGYYFAGAARFQRNDGGGAERAYRKALDLFTQAGDRYGLARVLLSLGVLAMDIHLDVGEARQLYDRAIPMIRESGDTRRLGIALGNLGEICRLEGHSAQAIAHAREALEIFRGLESHTDIGWQLANLAHFYALRRDYAQALDSLRAAYDELCVDPSPRWIAWYFDVWFIIAAQLERWDVAASLLGFCDHYRDANKAPRMQALFPWFSLPVERLAKRSRSEERLFELRLAGEKLSVAEAQALTENVVV